MQDFTRLKAILYNNMSACYFNLEAWQKSEYFNDLALSEDPDYAKALYRNILILEQKGLYSRGAQMA